MPQEPRIRVKFLSRYQSADADYDRWLRRFPGMIPSWGRCDFMFEQDCTDYDWLVVYDDFPRKPGAKHMIWEETLKCPRASTMLLTAEPSSIKLYGKGFLNQFRWILTSQEPSIIRHPGAIYRQAGLIWFYGNTDERGTYDGLAKQREPVKTADISTVCSYKQMSHTLHQTRYDFTQALKKAIPKMEIFGQGVRPIDDKADALDPFRYHVAIENHVCNHHWTEKLCDPFLGYCLPFYHGCTNASDYFPEESFIAINIHRFGETRDRIQKAIRDNEWEKRLPAIREARRLVLEKYGTFQQLAALIEERHPPEDTSVQEIPIYSRRAWRSHHPVRAIPDLVSKFVLQTRNRLTFRKFSEDS